MCKGKLFPIQNRGVQPTHALATSIKATSYTNRYRELFNIVRKKGSLFLISCMYTNLFTLLNRHDYIMKLLSTGTL